MSDNFSFIKQKYAVLYNVCDFAEKALYVDNNTTMIKARTALEIIVNIIINYEKQNVHTRATLDDKLRLFKSEGIFDRELDNLAVSIKTYGNNATHNVYTDFKSALYCLQTLFKIATWFYATYGNDNKFDYKTAKYQNPVKYEFVNDDDYKKLKTENDNIQKEFTILKEEYEILKTNEEILKSKEEKRKLTHDILNSLYLNEENTRTIIDRQLSFAGWECDSENINYLKGSRPELNKNKAIAEWKVGRNHADYALFIGLKFVGIVEAKKISIDVSSKIEEAKFYSINAQINENEQFVKDAPFGEYKIPFMFSANGREYNESFKEKSGIWFLDGRKATNHSKPLRNWYSPKDIELLLKSDIDKANENLKNEPFEYLKSKDLLNLRDYQIEAIQKTEEAVVNGIDKILITMATGTGKTKTAIGLCYRLLKSQRFKRILFLVDRKSLGIQTADKFKESKIENLQKFSSVYEIKEIDDIFIEDTTKIHIATVQGMSKRIFSPSDLIKRPSILQYDCVIIDEAHRGYVLDKQSDDSEENFQNQNEYLSRYKQVIEYFDAVKIALTATPALHTIQIFNKPVFTYSYHQAVIDGYLCDHNPPYLIKTEFNTNGIIIKKGELVEFYNKTDNTTDLTETEDEFDFEVDDFHKKIIVKSFNEIVLKEVFNNINIDDEGKTLIFAVNDSHADLVVSILKELFKDKEDDFIQKITGYVENQEESIKKFKNNKFPKIVVTVDLLTTGIDVPEIVNLVFIRRVKSRILYEQMIGRATRLCKKINKEHFNIFDCIDLYSKLKDFTDMTPVVANNTINLEKRVEIIKQTTDLKQLKEETDQFISKLHRKKSLFENIENQKNFQTLIKNQNVTFEEFVDNLKNSTVEERKEIITKEEELFKFIDKLKNEIVVVISEEQDKLLGTVRGYGERNLKPEDYLNSFVNFINQNTDKITALKILKQSPDKLTRAELRELVLKLKQNDFDENYLSKAYQNIKNVDITIDIINYIRNIIANEPIVSHERRIKRAIEKVKASNNFNHDQINWINRIEKQLLEENIFQTTDLNGGSFSTFGGYNGINKIFNNNLEKIINEINMNLYS